MDDIPGKIWLASDGHHIDVCNLAPPDPMYGILQLINRADVVEPVTVHIDRNPVPLYEELTEHGWQAERIKGDFEELRLKLTRL